MVNRSTSSEGQEFSITIILKTSSYLYKRRRGNLIDVGELLKAHIQNKTRTIDELTD